MAMTNIDGILTSEEESLLNIAKKEYSDGRTVRLEDAEGVCFSKKASPYR